MPAPPLDEPTGRFYAALGQVHELATAFAILGSMLPSAVHMPGPGRLLAVPGEDAAGVVRCS
jgi:hypothetical protein